MYVQKMLFFRGTLWLNLIVVFYFQNRFLRKGITFKHCLLLKSSKFGILLNFLHTDKDTKPKSFVITDDINKTATVLQQVK